MDLKLQAKKYDFWNILVRILLVCLNWPGIMSGMCLYLGSLKFPPHQCGRFYLFCLLFRNNCQGILRLLLEEWLPNDSCFSVKSVSNAGLLRYFANLSLLYVHIFNTFNTWRTMLPSFSNVPILMICSFNGFLLTFGNKPFIFLIWSSCFMSFQSTHLLHETKWRVMLSCGVLIKSKESLRLSKFKWVIAEDWTSLCTDPLK